MQKQISLGIVSMSTSQILLYTVLACALSTSQVYAKPTSASSPTLTPAMKPTLVQNRGGKLPAGTEASFILMLNPGSNSTALVQENEVAVIPITGKLGNKDIPKDSVLVGTFKRLDEKSGVFECNKLVLGTQVYAAKITSEPVNGRLMQDPKAMQAMASDMQGMMPSQAEQQKKIEEGNARAAASMVPNLLVGFIPGGELLSGAASAASRASEEAERKESEARGAAMTAKMATIGEAMKKRALFAEIAPRQSLKVQFMEAVDLNTPVATLSAPMAIQGFPALPPDSNPSAKP